MNLQQLKELFVSRGVKRLLAKELSPNDNNKNQPYFGPDFTALNLFPAKQVDADGSKNIKAKLDFGWLLPSGEVIKAPSAQLILYPKYPEVRFSGFLEGCKSSAPLWESMKSLMKQRAVGRILFLGVTDDQIFGFVVAGNSSIAIELALGDTPDAGVFHTLSLQLPSGMLDSRTVLLSELGRIHRKGWIDSKQLHSSGRCIPCNAPQGGGFTLEAELKISKNSNAEPDFMGEWEIKQHTVSSFLRPASGKPITMMTPEPTGGFYKEKGVEEFVRKFGYKDRNGREDRLNFGGKYTYGNRLPLTGLRILFTGYDLEKTRITDAGGAIILVNDDDVIAASWDFAGLIAHWSRKHAKAVYVPSKMRSSPDRQYCYGGMVRLAEQTDSLRLLGSVAAGVLYYDPAIKLEQASSRRPHYKTRSQWRVPSRGISHLYEKVEVVAV